MNKKMLDSSTAFSRADTATNNPSCRSLGGMFLGVHADVLEAQVAHPICSLIILSFVPHSRGCTWGQVTMRKLSSISLADTDKKSALSVPKRSRQGKQPRAMYKLQ